MRGWIGYSITFILVALLYALAGKASLLLAIPPGFAAPIWPPAAIALAAILLGGYRYLLAVLIGSVGANLIVSLNAGGDITTVRSLSTAAFIAMGATLQAGIAAYLIRRFISDHNRFSNYKDILLLVLLGGALGCTVNAVIGPLTLHFAGILPADILPANMYTWWVGDTIGVILFLPLLLLAANKTVSLLRKLIVIVPSLVLFALAIVSFFMIKDYLQSEKAQQAKNITNELTHNFEKELQTYINLLTANERFIVSSTYVSDEEFELFTQTFFRRYKGLAGMAWLPKVNHAERAEHEAAVRKQGYPDYTIRQRFKLGKMGGSEQRDIYFPVKYLHPYARNKEAHGLDVYGRDEVIGNLRVITLDKARDEAAPMATGRFPIVQAENQYGFVLYHPVFKEDVYTAPITKRRESLRGYTSGVFILPELMASMTAQAAEKGFDVVLHDKTADKLLFDSRTKDFKESPAAIAIHEQALQTHIDITFAGRKWQFHFIEQTIHTPYDLWLFLVLGLLISSGFTVFLIIISSRTESIHEEIHRASNAESSTSTFVYSGIAALVVLSLSLIVSQKFKSYELALTNDILEEELKLIKETIKISFSEQSKVLNRMALRWIYKGGLSEEEWRNDAVNYVQDHPGLRALEWADSDMRIRWVEPLKGNEKVLGLDITFEKNRKAIVEKARDKNIPTISTPIDFVQGGRGFLSYNPLYLGDTFDGFIVAVLDIQKMLGHIIPQSILDTFYIDVYANNTLMFSNNALKVPATLQHHISSKINLYDMEWEFKIFPKEAFLMQHESLLEEISLLAGVLFSLLAGFSVYTALISNKRSKLLVKKDAESNRLIEQLTESNTELERFAYIASHDMQEPIRMVTNFGEILEAEYGEKLDDTGREYVGFIVNAGTRLRDLVNDLLAYSRMGNENMQFKAFDGELVIKGVLENIQTLTKDKNARITHDTFPELTANPVQIMRLIQNLILNGIKYQPEGNEPHIHVGIEDQHSHWCISVKDNGLGIKDQFIDQIFQPFRRLHAWDAIQGTGLGLSICKKIVENHGGKIWVTSTPAEGSVFYFTIPKTPSKRGKA